MLRPAAQIDIQFLRPEGLQLYGALCGWTLARAHARSGDRIAIASYLGGSDVFDRAIARFASAYVVLPGGYGTLDELFEALTLVQTGKGRQMPIILVHEPFWRGLVGWLQERLVAEGMIDDTDCQLFQICNEPQQVVDAIFNFYEKRGFEPSPAEREVLLNL